MVSMWWMWLKIRRIDFRKQCKNCEKIIFGNSMLNYARKSLEGVTFKSNTITAIAQAV